MPISPYRLLVVCMLWLAGCGISQAAESYGPVRSGDSLWTISRDHRPHTRITINQMMIATFRKNPDAFGGNINWLYVNRTLALPDATEATALSAADADAEVIRQNEAWNNAVNKFVAADGDRRRQLNVILSGQQSNDPEIEALRAELRALVSGLKEENRALRDELNARNDAPEEESWLGTFFTADAWTYGASVGTSIGGFVSGAPAVVSEDNLVFDFHSERVDYDGSLLAVAFNVRRPLWGSMERFTFVSGAELALVDRITRTVEEYTRLIETETSPPSGSYRSIGRLEIDVQLLRLPFLLESALWTPRDDIAVVAGGGLVINHVLSSKGTYEGRSEDMETGELRGRSRLSAPNTAKVTADGLSFDLRLTGGARWTPEWARGMPLTAALELEQSLGDPFGSTGTRFKKTRFGLRFGIEF